jgi:hypothetical protein
MESSLRTSIYRRTLDLKDRYILSLGNSQPRTLTSTAVTIHPLWNRHDPLAKPLNFNFKLHIYSKEADLPFKNHASLKAKLKMPIDQRSTTRRTYSWGEEFIAFPKITKLQNYKASYVSNTGGHVIRRKDIVVPIGIRVGDLVEVLQIFSFAYGQNSGKLG